MEETEAGDPTSSAGPIIYSRHGRLGIVTLSRPAVVNALDLETVRALKQTIQASIEESSALVITGAGGNFSAGADLKELFTNHADRAWLRAFVKSVNDAFNVIESSPVPTIAAVEGVAFAGGFELLQAVDFVVAAHDARLGDMHVNYSLVPGAGGSQRLPRLIGMRRAKHLLMLPDEMSAAAAREIGLVDDVVPSGQALSRAIELAERVTERPRSTLAALKSMLHHGRNMPMLDALAFEQQCFLDYLSEPESLAGLASFLSRHDKAASQS